MNDDPSYKGLVGYALSIRLRAQAAAGIYD